MGVGVRYTFPYDVYPRYSYLQSWTEKLVSRFKKHIEKNNLSECVCDGDERLLEISKANGRLQNPVVTVFAQEQSMINGALGKQLVQTLVPFKYEKLVSKPMTWDVVFKEGELDSPFDSKILVVIAKDSDTETSNKLLKLSQTQLENTFFYNPTTNTYRLMEKDVDVVMTTKTVPRSLSADIQSVLELKVVMVMEKMKSYMLPLVPRQSLEPDQSLLDFITDNLKHFDMECLKEILDGKKDILIPKVTKEFPIPAKENITESQFPAKGNTTGRVKRKKDDTSLQETGQKKREKTFEGKSIKSRGRHIKPGSSQNKPQSCKDKDFTKPLDNDMIQKLIELIGRRMKCKMVEYFAMKFGVHFMVTTTLLFSHNFYNFDNKFSAWIQKEEIDDKGIDKPTAGRILKKCQTSVSQLVAEVSDFFTETFELLNVVHRHHFELQGLMRQSDFITKSVRLPQLSKSLQVELLRLPAVTGCGTIYGILTLHTNSDLSPASKQDIKMLLQQYNYHRNYKVERITSTVKQVGKTSDDAHTGCGLSADCNDGVSTRIGTLGCFVQVLKKTPAVQEPQTSKQSEKANKSEKKDGKNERQLKSPTEKREQPSRENAHNLSTEQSEKSNKSENKDGKNERQLKSPTEKREQPSGENAHNLSTDTVAEAPELHIVTCQHCFVDCNRVIKKENDKNPLAIQTEYCIASGQRYDIALLRVREERRKECVLNLRVKDNSKRDDVRYPWQLCQGLEGLEAKPVYKFGRNLPHYTCGVIASNNYRTIMEDNAALQTTHPEHVDPSTFMDPMVNVIVGADTPFSKPSDSGSVICSGEINGLQVTAVSILHGEIIQNGRWLHSYSALLKGSFNELERRFGIEISLPTFSESNDNPFEIAEESSRQEGGVGQDEMDTDDNNTGEIHEEPMETYEGDDQLTAGGGDGIPGTEMGVLESAGEEPMNTNNEAPYAEPEGATGRNSEQEKKETPKCDKNKGIVASYTSRQQSLSCSVSSRKHDLSNFSTKV